MRLLRRFSSFLFLFLPIFVAGCSLFGGPELPSLKDYRPVSADDAEKFLASVRTAAERIHSARGRFQANLSKGLTRQSLDQVLVFRRPDDLRIELFASSLNQLALMVVTSGGLLEALDPKENVLYRGAGTPQNIAKIIGVPLLPEELMVWFAGAVVLPADGKYSVQRDPAGTFALSGDLPLGRVIQARFETTAQGLTRLLSLELRRRSDGELFFFSEFHYGVGELPEKISLNLPEQELRGELKSANFRVNPDNLTDRLFQIPPREGTRIEVLQ